MQGHVPIVICALITHQFNLSLQYDTVSLEPSALNTMLQLALSAAALNFERQG